MLVAPERILTVHIIITFMYVDKQSCIEWTQRLVIGEMVTVMQ